MNIDLTEQQRQEILDGKPVRISSAELGRDVVVLTANAFEQLAELVQDEREQSAFRAFARKQAAKLAQENPY